MNKVSKITDLISRTAAKLDTHIALYETSQTWTYKQMWLDVVMRSKFLKEQGVKSGMGIGVMGQNSAEFITSMLAVMYVGGVAFPISHNLKPDEIDTLCRRTALHVLWDDGSSKIPESYMLLKESGGVTGWRWTPSPYASENNQLITDVEDPALVRFTSGTTGKSKGVILSHRSIIERTECANHALNLSHKDVVIWVLSMAYHFVVSILLYLRQGCSICICESFMADYLLERTNELDGTFLYVSPMHIRMLNRESSFRKLPTLNRVVSTSMAISSDLCTKFEERYDLPITQAFGIIEIGLPVINMRDAGSEPAAIGHPLPEYDVTVLDDLGKAVETGEVGQLAIRGPGMFDAYLDPFMSREEAMDFGFFLTGDLAQRSADDRITIVGRKKNVINVSGNKAFPEEVEAVIKKFPGVEACRVKGFIHPLLNECVMAEIVCNAYERPDVESLITYCRKRLSTYKVPQKIVFVDHIPMTDSGKIKRS